MTQVAYATPVSRQSWRRYSFDSLCGAGWCHIPFIFVMKTVKLHNHMTAHTVHRSSACHVNTTVFILRDMPGTLNLERRKNHLLERIVYWNRKVYCLTPRKKHSVSCIAEMMLTEETPLLCLFVSLFQVSIKKKGQLHPQAVLGSRLGCSWAGDIWLLLLISRRTLPLQGPR